MSDSEILTVLTQIRDLLAQQQAQEKLGFGQPPTPTTIFINRSHGGCWYRLENGNPVVIQEPALTCRLQAAHFETVSRRDKETSKLRISVVADRPYILEAGGTTQFSRSFLAACAMFPAALCTAKSSPSSRATGRRLCFVLPAVVNGELVRGAF